MIKCRVSDFPVSPDDLQRLAKLVEQHDLAELRYEEGALRVTLRTTVPQPPVVVAGSAVAPAALTLAPGVAPTAPAPSAVAAPPAGVPIEAPIMGVFYRSPAPGAPAFIEVGDTIAKDQPIGTIEAMKVFSEVLADRAGRVVAIPAENGKLVQPGDALVLLES